MSSSQSRHHGYIPLGCLVLSNTNNPDLDPELFSSELFDQWHVLLPEPGETVEGSATGRLPPFPPFHQSNLLKSKLHKTAQLNRLLEAHWIHLEYKVSISDGNSRGILRVYVLPDDILHSTIDRSDATLHKSRKTLLSHIDYSNEAWLGHSSAELQPHPQLHDPVSLEEDDPQSASLLEMFNTIKAPDPTPDQARDPYLRYVVNNLLESSIEGLTTRLYPYQRRSVATMALREVQPEQFLDPRLVHVKDQSGNPWYYDASDGVIYRESRSYDGVQGGILAEQMGAGKTAICLALVLATRPTPTPPPPYRTLVQPPRKRTGVASLTDMAAACVTRNGLPYRWQFDAGGSHTRFTRCLEALERNPGAYEIPTEDSSSSRKKRWLPGLDERPVIKPPKRILISQTSFITAPQNLLQQWQEEVAKHTTGLAVLVLDRDSTLWPPRPEFLAQHDIILCSHTQLEKMVRKEPRGPMENNSLTHIHFKRCIVDEGHRLGNSKINAKSDFHRGLDALHVTAKWIVTGTPSRGLYGVDEGAEDQTNNSSSSNQEKWDLEKLGAIAQFYLKARPWANTLAEGERPAEWREYVVNPMIQGRGMNRYNTLRDTLNSLIVRHPLSQLTHMYPSIDEKITVLEGSYQDKLALDVFSMIIIFNSVQSQRTDVDYFFHPRGRTALMQLVRNLKQAGFFGGGFFSKNDISTALETAKKFLDKNAVPINEEDDALIRSAIQFGEVAIKNAVKQVSNDHHELPILVKDFLPGSAAVEAWSFDVGEKDDHQVCTNATLVAAAQKLIRASLRDQSSMNTLLNGQLIDKGKQEKVSADKDEEKAAAKQGATGTMAGNTKLGVDRSSTKMRSNALHVDLEAKVKSEANADGKEIELPEEFRKARLVATASAKMTYLMDCVLQHQADEQIIIFYENDNTAFAVAGMLDVIQVPYLIYAKSLTVERKARYIHTFNHDDKFRVLLMDMGQAAYGLDMRAASRIVFLTPVLNPQVQAQAIGRVRRISQQKPVSVETLVLRGSMEEVILQRKNSMSAAEHWRVKSLLDDQSIYDWIRNARIRFNPKSDSSAFDQFVPLKHPQPIFGTGSGHVEHPDADIMDVEVHTNGTATPQTNGVKRGAGGEHQEPLARRVRFV